MTDTLKPISPQPPLPSSTVPTHRAHILQWTGFADKTLWDWLQLLAMLAVPLALGLATYNFNAQQADLAQNQHALDKVSAVDQQREAALQSYLDRMSDLLLGNNTGQGSPSLRMAHQNDQTSQVARARTLTVLRSLDGRRKGTILQFLYDAGLISSPSGTTAIVDLRGADLTGATLSKGANLSNAVLSGTDLSGADLSGADLSGAHLIGTNLSSVLLTEGTNLKGADLTGANLINANLSNANLSNANLTGGVNLSNAILRGINISQSNLVGTVFHKADLSGAEMWNADLRQANLDEADLSGADLSADTIAVNTSFANAIYTRRTNWPDNFDPQKAHAVKTDRRVLPAFVDFNTSSSHYHLANATLKTIIPQQGSPLNYFSVGGGQQVAIEFDLQKDDLAQTKVTVDGLISQDGPSNAGDAPISLQLNGHPAFESNYTIPGGGYQATSQDFPAPSTQLVAGTNTLIFMVAPDATTNFWLYRLEIDLKSS